MPLEKIVDKLMKSKFDIYLSTVGLFFIAGAVYIYLNFYRDNQTKDGATILIIFMFVVFGYIFTFTGILEAFNKHNMELEIFELHYKINKINLEVELKNLREQYNIKEKTSKLEIIKKFLKEKLKLIKRRRKFNQSQPPINPNI